MQNVLNRIMLLEIFSLRSIIKTLIYSLVFLLPLFWLPFGASEFNKQYLLFFLVLITSLVWLIRMILVDKEIKFKKTPLNIPILAFLFIAIISAIFSVDRFFSLFGSYGRFSDGLIGLLSLGILYFLIINNVNKIASVIRVILCSALFVILCSYFSIFGIWTKISSALGGIFPQLMLQRTFNPISGSMEGFAMEGLAVFLSAILVLLVGFLIIQNHKAKLQTLFYWLLLIATLGLLLIIDFKATWIVLAAILALFVIFAIVTRMFRENVNRLLLPIFLLMIAVILIIADLPKTDYTTLPKESILGQAESWTINLKTAINSPKNIFLGSGVGTFFYDFSKFKPAEINRTSLWQTRFDRAGNQIAETVGTMGFLGALFYLGLTVLFLIISWIFIKTNISEGASKTQGEDKPNLYYQLPLFIALLALFFFQFVYYQNTTLVFMFWLIIGLSTISWQRDFGELKYSFKEFPEIGLVFSVLLVVIILGVFTICFFGAKFYLAEIKYQKAIFGSAQLSAEEQLKLLEEAANLNPYQAQYKVNLARAYLREVLNEMAKPLNQQDPDKLTNSSAKAVTYIKGGELPIGIGVVSQVPGGASSQKTIRILGATELSPNWVVAWETQGIIYREIRTMVADPESQARAAEWGIKSFERAISLEPANPGLHTELGKILLAQAPEEAKKKFQEALELKPDYSNAKIQLALLFRQGGNLKEAISQLEEVVAQEPFNIEAIFQLGRVYYENNQIDEAILQLQRAILFFPDHSNSLYVLGLALQQKGMKQEAIAVFEKILELNPGNQDVIQKLEELKR